MQPDRFSIHSKPKQPMNDIVSYQAYGCNQTIVGAHNQPRKFIEHCRNYMASALHKTCLRNRLNEPLYQVVVLEFESSQLKCVESARSGQHRMTMWWAQL